MTTDYLRSLRVAFGFLTTLPVPIVHDWRDDDLRRAVQAYPLVGLALGLLLTLAFFLLLPFPPLLRGVLLTVFWLGLTGALHFDGFCDMADAALVMKAPEERWRIAKDPRVGSFALAAGVLLLLSKAAALGSLVAWPALLVVPILSRSAVIWAMARYRVHDSSLLGRSSRLEWRETYLPLGLGLGLSALLSLILLPPLALFLLVSGAAFATLALARFLDSRMDGLGGDAYGAIVEGNEALMLILATLIL